MRRSGCHYLGTPLAEALSAGCTADFKELELGNTPARLLARVQGTPRTQEEEKTKKRRTSSAR
jgi:hypothetical protein